MKCLFMVHDQWFAQLSIKEGDDAALHQRCYKRTGSNVISDYRGAGGLGINLYTADIVVLFDSDW